MKATYESREPPPSGDVHSIVPPHCNGHQNGQQSGYMLHRCFVDCCPGGCRDNMEQVVAQWQCPVASDEALVKLHWAMRSALLQCIRVTIEKACNRDAHDCCRCLFHLV